jgi:hypothetical protein
MLLVARADMAVACARVVQGVPADGERRLASKFRSSSAPALPTAASPHSRDHNGEVEPSREHLPRPGCRRRVAGNQIRRPARPCSHSAATGPAAPTRGREPPGRLHKRAGRIRIRELPEASIWAFPPEIVRRKRWLCGVGLRGAWRGARRRSSCARHRPSCARRRSTS